MCSLQPRLTGYLDDLLRTRERLAATVEGVDEWARADATPAEEEITSIRRLINKIKGDISQLTDTERAAVDDAVAVVRRHRSAAARSASACPPSAPHFPRPGRSPSHEHPPRHRDRPASRCGEPAR